MVHVAPLKSERVGIVLPVRRFIDLFAKEIVEKFVWIDAAGAAGLLLLLMLLLLLLLKKKKADKRKWGSPCGEVDENGRPMSEEPNFRPPVGRTTPVCPRRTATSTERTTMMSLFADSMERSVLAERNAIDRFRDRRVCAVGPMERGCWLASCRGTGRIRERDGGVSERAHGKPARDRFRG
jgi:hypothetical protein